MEQQPELKWTKLMGAFALATPERVVFSGGPSMPNASASGAPTAPVGILLSNQPYGEGIVRAGITFDAVTFDSARPPACGLILYRSPGDGSLVQVQIGGPALCSLWSFDVGLDGGGGWRVLAQAGMSSSIDAKHKYQVEVTVTGSNVGVRIDGARVLTATLPFPLQRGEAGIFCQSESGITVEDFIVEGRPIRAFIVMQFTEAYNALYREVIDPVCRKQGVEPLRADEMYGPGLIIQDIERQIREAQVVIAEVSPDNPNVYYEVGYAHAIRKPTILIASAATKRPFDVSGFRTLLYEDSIAGKGKVETGLRSHLEEILKSLQGG